MEWEKENVCLLIDLYREKPVLWDPTNPDYKNRNRKHDAWGAIAATMDMSRDEVEGKMRKLIGQFNRESKKGKSGSGADEVNPKWFAYKLLLFLKDKTLPKHSREAGFADLQKETDQADRTLDIEDEDDGSVNQDDNTLTDSATTIVSGTSQATLRKVPFSYGTQTTGTKKRKTTYEMANEAYTTMKSLEGRANMAVQRDEYDAFGEYVAHSLRNLKTKHAKVMVKHEINALLFQGEMGHYDEPNQTNHITFLSSSATTTPSPLPSSTVQPTTYIQQPEDNGNSPTKDQVCELIAFMPFKQ